MAKENKDSQVEITEVVTQTTVGYKLPDGETVDLNQYLVWLGNLVLDIKKAVD